MLDTELSTQSRLLLLVFVVLTSSRTVLSFNIDKHLSTGRLLPFSTVWYKSIEFCSRLSLTVIECFVCLHSTASSTFLLAFLDILTVLVSLPPKALLIVSIDARKISMQCFDGIDMLKFSMKPSIVVFVLLIPSLLPNVSLKYSVIVNVK